MTLAKVLVRIVTLAKVLVRIVTLAQVLVRIVTLAQVLVRIVTVSYRGRKDKQKKKPEKGWEREQTKQRRYEPMILIAISIENSDRNTGTLQ